jgi:hypothetical protein
VIATALSRCYDQQLSLPQLSAVLYQLQMPTWPHIPGFSQLPKTNGWSKNGDIIQI